MKSFSFTGLVLVPEMDEDQDAGTLKFANFWKNAQSLNICEVESVLRGPFARMNSEGRTIGHLDKAYRHSLRFSRIRDVQALQQLRVALEDWEPPSSIGALVDTAELRLAPFEVAQFVNLVPADPDEAKALMPSLDRFSNSDILSVLEIIGQYSKLQVSEALVL